MYKRIIFYSLPEGTDPDKFWKYHTEVHAVDVKKVAGSRLKKYVINRVTNVESGELKFFGLIELWWESEEAMNDAYKDMKFLKTSEGKILRDDFYTQVITNLTASVEELEIL